MQSSKEHQLIEAKACQRKVRLIQEINAKYRSGRECVVCWDLNTGKNRCAKLDEDCMGRESQVSWITFIRLKQTITTL